MDNKVYYPEVIADTPFPSQSTQPSQTATQPSVNGTYNPAQIAESPFPVKRIAVELLSTALNTRSKEIMQPFDFAPSGALQIGQYTNGVNGDIKISPAGIVGRNMLGDPTFVLDGETGDATFRGTVQADDFVIADENGLVSASVFQTDSYDDDTIIDESSGFAAQDVPGSTLNLTLVRPARVLITFFANIRMVFIDSLKTYRTQVWIDVDGVNVTGITEFVNAGVADASSGILLGTCVSSSRIVLLSQGDHVLKMRWFAFSDEAVEMHTRGYDYCMLGS